VRVLVGLVLSLMIAGLVVPSTSAGNSPNYMENHQAGVRLGGWANRGDTPPDSFNLTSGGYYTTDFGTGSFYLEGFYAWRLKASLMAEISLGMVTRGDVILVETDGGSSIGAAQIYPILAKLKFYPLGTRPSKFIPYLLAGGGFYYGRHDIQIATGYDAYLRQTFGEDSRTTFTYVLGGGFDWPVASVVALDFQAQYMPIDFSGDLIGIENYRALTITVGVKYLMSKDKDNNKQRNYTPRRGR